MRKLALGVAVSAALAAPGIASATDGYFAHGYGMKASGMGGAATAMTDDAFGGANNPATMVFVGDRIDAGVTLFRPDRHAERVGSAGFFPGGSLDASVDGNDTNNFLIPEFGYNHMLRPDISLGVSVYGNGGMNTDYPNGVIPAGRCGANPANLLCGSSNLGVDLSQLIIAPTVAYKIAPEHSIGVSPLIAYQRFKAYGLQAFSAISSDPSNLTNNGYDSSWGLGVRVGYYGRITPTVAIGAQYSPQIRMGKLDKYKGLFADGGGFDIPENFSVGISVKATPAVTIAADYERINYSKVDSVGNPSNVPGCMPTFPAGPGVGAGCLGASSSSIGFGWQDVNVIKLGVAYQYSPQLTLRAGYNHSDNPIQARDVTFNILAPGVVQDHLTLGFTYGLQGGSEITMAYMHAFKKSVSGPATNPYFNVGGTETISLSEDALGIAWGKSF
ncbi:MAG: outer membrane protein transport protein [Betaproteobacteria bacterium]|nr:outer membrane protein transport protein [Betaproteobacteria bacterium]